MAGCLCGCGRMALRRGLANSCYARLGEHVRRGLTTWARLEREGKALPAAKRHNFFRK